MNNAPQLNVINRPLPRVFHSCFGGGCRGMAWPGELYCRECQAQLDALDKEAEREQQSDERRLRREQLAASIYARQASGAASRLGSVGWASVSIGVCLLLLWETRSFWLELIRMWARRL